jgi:hypothetical protein
LGVGKKEWIWSQGEVPRIQDHWITADPGVLILGWIYFQNSRV